MALTLGLLVGMERERTAAAIAGFRTFALVPVMGTLAALLSPTLGPWLAAVGLAGVLAVGIVGQRAEQGKHEGPGTTTLVALAVMYLVGVYLVFGSRTIGVMVGVATAILLHFKPALHAFAQRLGREDMLAVLQFTIVTFVVVPLLPNQTYGPLAVFNPREAWYMVVLIVAMSLLGYVLDKIFGARVGIALGAAIGGLVSSTAITVSYARRSVAVNARNVAFLAGGVLLASAIVYVRVVVEAFIVAPVFGRVLVLPMAVMLAASVAMVAAVWVFARRVADAPHELPDDVEAGGDEKVAHRNPTELGSALVFGVLFVLVKLGVAGADSMLGSDWLYAVAILSGLTDMDAITLSTARLVAEGRLAADVAWRMVLVGSMANVVFKAGIVVLYGVPQMRKLIVGLFGAMLAVGGLTLWLL